LVKIRLMRLGSRHNPFYRVVVMDIRAPQKSRFIENLGYYNPTKNPQIVELKEERVAHWLGCGAQPTDTAKSLFRQQGILRRIHEARTGTAPAESSEDGAEAEAESSES
jgi:small subunit ribosomal protein S16